MTCGDVLDTEDLGYVYDDTNPVLESGSATGVTDGWSTIGLSQAHGGSPAVLAAMQTFNGSDPAGTRIRNAGSTTFEARIEEEASSNTETTHVAERLGYLVGSSGILHDMSGVGIGELMTIRDGSALA